MISIPNGNLQAAAVLNANSPQKTTTSGKPADTDAKIEKSAKDFEAILLGNWLGQAEQSFARAPGSDEDDDDDSATSQFTQMSMQSLGASFAGSGGIGIAKMISAQLHKTEANAANTAATQSAETSTVKLK